MIREFLKALSAVLLLSLLVACAAAPVQEMSDARQAVEAAADAGAGEFAAGLLDSARSLLESAESKLQQHLFTGARRDAEAAREDALEALRITLEAKGEETR
jgi:hypothetical protein